jgi:RimJ/RimL family protein N-acetyltransferase
VRQAKTCQSRHVLGCAWCVDGSGSARSANDDDRTTAHSKRPRQRPVFLRHNPGERQLSRFQARTATPRHATPRRTAAAHAARHPGPGLRGSLEADMSEAPAEQPVGKPVAFGGATPPVHTVLQGRLVTLRPIDPYNDAASLYAASHAPTGDPTIWTYLYDGPYADLESFRESLRAQAARHDYVFFAVADARDNRPLGIASYLSIVPEHGVIEIGNIWFSPELQRTPAATEAILLLARHAFDELGYRRLEWKCNALNEPSRRAAARFGFHFEGVFRNHRIVKGLVCDHRRALAGSAVGVRAVAEPRELRRRRKPALAPGRAHRSQLIAGTRNRRTRRRSGYLSNACSAGQKPSTQAAVNQIDSLKFQGERPTTRRKAAVSSRKPHLPADYTA